MFRPPPERRRKGRVSVIVMNPALLPIPHYRQLQNEQILSLVFPFSFRSFLELNVSRSTESRTPCVNSYLCLLHLPRLTFHRRSATDSVMSLPLLNMVRGVPFSHRGLPLLKLLIILKLTYGPVVPLRVTNPDRMSM